MEPARKSTVLVVEDDSITRVTLVKMLNKIGFATLEAADGAAAMSIAKEKTPDLVLLDLHMPVMDGMEVLKLIREEQTMIELPVIICTATNSDESIEIALTRGANDYLVKPIRLQALTARVCLQIKILELTRNLAAQQHQAAVAAMVVTYNHEINNPLSVALGHIHFLRKGQELSPKIAASISKIEGSLQRIAEMVKKIGEASHSTINFQSYEGDTQMVSIGKKGA